jgi:hypothetical protein
VIPNLLDSHETAFSFVLRDRFMSVEGPQRKPGYNPHEFVHAVTNPLSFDPRFASLQAEASMVLPSARTVLRDARPARSIAAFMDECLVRAISLRYRVRQNSSLLPALEATMISEWREGYILERFFWEQLELMERRRGTLSASYPEMLRALDVSAELERWTSERAKIAATRQSFQGSS